jgi:hypothetical protein
MDYADQNRTRDFVLLDRDRNSWQSEDRNRMRPSDNPHTGRQVELADQRRCLFDYANSTYAFLVLTLAMCIYFTCLLFRGALDSRREWEVRNQNLMVRQESMQVAHPFAFDETGTALLHGDMGVIAGGVIYEKRKAGAGSDSLR